MCHGPKSSSLYCGSGAQISIFDIRQGAPIVKTSQGNKQHQVNESDSEVNVLHLDGEETKLYTIDDE